MISFFSRELLTVLLRSDAVFLWFTVHKLRNIVEMDQRLRSVVACFVASEMCATS